MNSPFRGKVYKSKVNRKVTYESSTVGSYKYVTMFYNGIKVAPENKPIKSIKKAIENAELSLQKATQYEDLKDILKNTYLAKYLNNERK